MTTYYVGPGGSDGNNGTTWALRKLTLNGAEDIPVAADDTVYVGPGVYRHTLTCDLSGSSGQPITYIGDVTGVNTDGIGGIVRVTGSDNDQSATRSYCIDFVSYTYRTFRGFTFDTVSSFALYNPGSNVIIEDCVFQGWSGASAAMRRDADITDITVRRCLFFGARGPALEFNRATEATANFVIENCAFIGGMQYAVTLDKIAGSDIRNCLFLGNYRSVRAVSALTGTLDVNNCIFQGNYDRALWAIATGDIVEDYNTFFANGTDKLNVSDGSNSVTYPAVFGVAVLFDGHKFPWWIGELSEWSQIARATGSNEPSADLFGLSRPATASKNSWGPFQFADMEVEDTTVQAGSYGRVLIDAGLVLARRIPTDGTSVTVTLYVRRETNYAGSVPRMVVKQPGQADRTTDMTAAVDTWEQLSDTFTPASPPGFVEVWVESRNTATSGSYKVYYDTMGVS